MENWQLTLVVLGSLVTGALMPIVIFLSIALYRATNEIGKRLTPILDHVETITDRVEGLSRGLDGGAKSITETLSVMGKLAQAIERNMNIITVSSAVASAAGPAITAFIRTMHRDDEKSAGEASKTSSVNSTVSSHPPDRSSVTHNN